MNLMELILERTHAFMFSNAISDQIFSSLIEPCPKCQIFMTEGEGSIFFVLPISTNEWPAGSIFSLPEPLHFNYAGDWDAVIGII